MSYGGVISLKQNLKWDFCQTLRIDLLCLSHFQFAQLFYLSAIFHEQFELKHSLEKQLLS